MELIEKVVYLLVGGGIGYILGYITARLRAIEEKVDTVDVHMKDTRDERGFMRKPLVADVLYLLVLVIVVTSSFVAQKASNEVEATQHQLKRTVECISKYNVKQAESLSRRDKVVKVGTRSEIKLWTKYAELYAQAKADPSKIPEAQDALNEAIKSHRDALVETQITRSDHPYPDPDVLKFCKENPNE